MKEGFCAALKAFQNAAIHKIAVSGLCHSEMVDRTLTFFAEEENGGETPTGIRDINALLAEAKKASR